MSYTPPAGNAIEFVAVAGAYTPPAGNALEFGNPIPIAISGTSTASFYPKIDLAMAGSSTATFVNSSYGTLARTANIAGAATVGFHIQAYLDSPTSISNSSSSITAGSAAFGASTYSLIAQQPTVSFAAQEFAGGVLSGAGVASAAFDPIYGFSITGVATDIPQAGGLSSHAYIGGGSSVSALVSGLLRASTAAWAGAMGSVVRSGRVFPGVASISGAASYSSPAVPVFAATLAASGGSSVSAGAGGALAGSFVTYGASTAAFVQAPFGSTHFVAAGLSGIEGFVGGAIATSSNIAATAGLSLYGRLVKQAHLDAAGAIQVAAFDSAFRVQGLRYATGHIITVTPMVWVVSDAHHEPVIAEQLEIPVMAIRADMPLLTYPKDITVAPTDAKLLYSS